MNKACLLAATGLLLAPAAAMAENTPAATPQATHSATTMQSDRAGTSHESMREKVRSDMQNAGFTDIRVIPDSFLVRAKDKSGNPVMMLINPDSVTEVLGAESGSNNQDSASSGDTTQGTFAQLSPTGEDMTSKVVGLDVYNNNHQDIGTIKDIAYEGHRIKAYIVGVGGFLGMGDRYVAVNPSALHVSYDSNGKTWHASLNTTADQLKSAPQFKYPSQG
jgi:hypothetical protein